jgi:hypothetical protein
LLAGEAAGPRQVWAAGVYGERLQQCGGHDGGWTDFGPLRRITRSQGDVLYELHGRPALDLYQEYLGRLADGLPNAALLFPLSIRAPRSGSQPLVRTILDIDEKSRSMTFAGDMPHGNVAGLMHTTDEGLVNSAGNALAQATCGMVGTPQNLAISVSCVGRPLVLGERAEEEVESLEQGVPTGAAHVGLYLHGEIAHGRDGGVSQLHSQTLAVTVLSEA